MELTHVEVSVATGTLDPAFEGDLDRLLHRVFGWTGATTVDVVPDLGPSNGLDPLSSTTSWREHSRCREATIASSCEAFTMVARPRSTSVRSCSRLSSSS